jgi:hypothetical protein
MAIRQKPSEHRQCNAERVVSAALREGRQFCVHAPCVCVRRKIEEDDFDGGCGEACPGRFVARKSPPLILHDETEIE